MSKVSRKRPLGHYEAMFLLSRDYIGTLIIQARSRKSAARKAAKLTKEDIRNFWCRREKLVVKSLEALSYGSGGRCHE